MVEQSFKFEWTRYRLGIVASAIRERLYAAADGRLSISDEERQELENALASMQGAIDGE